MSLAQFLEQLRATSPNWIVNDHGELRWRPAKGRKAACCPITAVEKRHLHAAQYAEAGQVLGLNSLTMRKIAAAADLDADWDLFPALREQLLAATVNRA